MLELHKLRKAILQNGKEFVTEITKRQKEVRE